MPPTDRLLAFMLTSLVLIAIPGPSVLFTIGRALTIGRRGALRSVVGNAVGAYLQVIAVSCGIGALVEESSRVYTVIRFVGAGYLVFLGVQAVRHRHALARSVTSETTPRSSRRQFLDGVLVGVTNPKVIVFFSVALPQFADPSIGHVPLQLLILGASFPLIALACDSGWALAAGTARSWLARSPTRLSTIGAAGGVAIAGLGITVAVTGGGKD